MGDRCAVSFPSGGNDRPQTHFWCAYSPGNVSGVRKCRPVSENPKIDANVVAAECTLCYHVHCSRFLNFT